MVTNSAHSSRPLGRLIRALYGDPSVTTRLDPGERLRLEVLGGVRLYLLVMLTTLTVFTPVTFALDSPGFVFNAPARLTTFLLMAGGIRWTFRKCYTAAGEGVALVSVLAISSMVLLEVRVSGVPDHPLMFAPTLFAAGLALFVPVKARALAAVCGAIALVPVPLWWSGLLEAQLALMALYVMFLATVAFFGALGTQMRRATLARQFTAEAALRELNAELESRVETRTRELQASEERFERLFQHAPQAMMMVNDSRCVVQSNRSAQLLFGYDQAELTGLPVAQLVPAASAEQHDELMENFFAEPRVGRMASGRRVEGVRRDGNTFAAEIGLVPLDMGGEPQVLAGVTDMSEQLAAQETVAHSLQEKETLLKEIHHRVKNNLQIISSMLMLQSKQMNTEDAQSLLQESVYRVRSMALIHQQLYGVESLERIDMGDYAERLATSLRGALAPAARLKVRAAAVEVTVDQAVPLGLILNELLTNAFKYGLRDPGAKPSAASRTGPDCEILIEVESVDDNLRIAVTDSGPGLPDNFDPTTDSTLGLQLVYSLSRQLRAKLTADSDGGTCFELLCPRKST